MTGKVINRPLIRSVAFGAAIVGTIQAAVWFSLSLVAVLMYYSYIEIDANLSPHNYLRILYDTFLNHDYTNEDVIVTTKNFNIFMYLYVVSSLIWLFISLYMLWAMKRNKWRNNSVIIGLWSGITIVISIIDIVLIGLVVADYITIQDVLYPTTTPPDVTDSILTTEAPFPTLPDNPVTSTTLDPSTEAPFPSSPDGPVPSTTLDPSTGMPSSASPDDIVSSTPLDPSTETSISPSPTTGQTNQPEGGESGLLLTKSLSELIVVDANLFQDFSELTLMRQLINTTYIIVMTLAARGYILWLINVILSIILIKFAVDISKQKTPSLLPMIDGYSTGRSPWTNNLYEQTDIGNGYSNGGFTDDNDRAAFPRSDSFVTTEPEIMHQNPLSNGHNPYAHQMDKLRPVSTNPNVVPISDNPNVVSPKLAKIGKQNGRRTPPRNVPPPNIPNSNSPHIPDPDYSPPGSPLKPKSALRPRSNYVL